MTKIQHAFLRKRKVKKKKKGYSAGSYQINSGYFNSYYKC